MASQKDFLKFYYDLFLPAYSDLVAYLADKPQQVLVEFENIATHIIQYVDSPKTADGKENLNKAYNHLIRITIDCSKILWAEMDKRLEKVMNNIYLRSFALNMSQSNFYQKYAEFKETARKARIEEIKYIGKDPMRCVNEYAKANEIGWSILKNIDPEKEKSLLKFKIVHYIKSNIIGFFLGIAASIIATLIWNFCK